MKELNDRLEDRGIGIKLTDEAVSFVVENAYDPIYGARPLKRYLQKYVETAAARIILEGNISEGDVIEIDVAGDGLSARAVHGS